MIHNNQQEARLYCRITIMGQRYEISLNCTIRKTSWNKDAQKCVGKTETDRIANRSIEDFRIQVQEAIDRVQVKGQELNIENIRLNLYSQENEYNTISRLLTTMKSSTARTFAKEATADTSSPKTPFRLCENQIPRSRLRHQRH